MQLLGFIDDAANFKFDNPSAWRYAREKLKGYEVVLSVKKKPKRQGTQSLRYYFGVVVPDIATACGYADNDEWASVHEGLAWKFLRLPDGPFGEPRRRHLSKDDMSQPELTTYIDQVITYAETSIPGCVVRRPGEVDLERVPDEAWS